MKGTSSNYKAIFTVIWKLETKNRGKQTYESHVVQMRLIPQGLSFLPQ